MANVPFTCKCCDLSWPGPEFNYYGALFTTVPAEPDLCAMCEGHQGNGVKMGSEHAAEYKERLVRADDAVAAATVENGELKRQILNLEREKDRLLDLLAKATSFHHRRVPYDKECVCGQAHCQTCSVGVDPWLYDQQLMKKARIRKASEAS